MGDNLTSPPTSTDKNLSADDLSELKHGGNNHRHLRTDAHRYRHGQNGASLYASVEVDHLAHQVTHFFRPDTRQLHPKNAPVVLFDYHIEYPIAIFQIVANLTRSSSPHSTSARRVFTFPATALSASKMFALQPSFKDKDRTSLVYGGPIV